MARKIESGAGKSRAVESKGWLGRCGQGVAPKWDPKFTKRRDPWLDSAGVL